MDLMLPCNYAASRLTFPCYIQPRLAGLRTLYQFGHFQLADDHHLRHLTTPLKKILPGSVILDGVLIEKGEEPTEFHIFDVVDFRRPFSSRFMAPASLLTDTQHRHKVKVVETHRILSKEPLPYFYRKWLEAGHRGIIYRLNDCAYVPGKSANLLQREKRTPRPREPDEC